MDLTLIRHLPTEWNQKGVLQGSRDIPILALSKADKMVIEKNKQILKQKEPFSLILTSTLTRTQQTAKAYGYANFKTESLLNELNFGEFEGKEKQLLVETHQEEWFTNPRDIVLGEKIAELEKRMLVFINKYHNYESILVFGHGSWIRACLSYYRYGTINSMNQIEIKNNQMQTIDVREEEFQLGGSNI